MTTSLRSLLACAALAACGGSATYVPLPTGFESNTLTAFGDSPSDFWLAQYAPTGNGGKFFHYDGSAWSNPVSLRGDNTIRRYQYAHDGETLVASDSLGLYRLHLDGTIDDLGVPADFDLGTDGSESGHFLSVTGGVPYVAYIGATGSDWKLARYENGAWKPLAAPPQQVNSLVRVGDGTLLADLGADPNMSFQHFLFDGTQWKDLGSTGSNGDWGTVGNFARRGSANLWRLLGASVKDDEQSQTSVVTYEIAHYDGAAWHEQKAALTVSYGDLVEGRPWVVAHGSGARLLWVQRDRRDGIDERRIVGGELGDDELSGDDLFDMAPFCAALCDNQFPPVAFLSDDSLVAFMRPVKGLDGEKGLYLIPAD